MGISSIKYMQESYIYEQKVNRQPVSNPVIYGRFPKYVHKKSSIEKVNKFLSVILMGLVVLSLVSYYFVSDSEKIMNNLGREIVALSNENIELQNKIDNLHSFNRVDTVINGNSMLDTAKKVIEIPAVNNVSVPKINPIPVNYKWSMGY